ncbi:hypothetical protein [Pseudomonas sp. R32]|uniref:hypothetical protein n=1 Tax=Pseudomonas sp. R32 TaxID=1573704 RepID=UPI00132EC100|nr:hypothetical protein [Pseudomonas sp. R32]QHF28056.1 hypothetical protein PspR32_09710 [Pseudomonas sp. R32]
MESDENAPGNRSQQNVTRTTTNETGHDSRRDEPEVPLPPDDETPVEQELSDMHTNHSQPTERPQAVNKGRTDQPDADSQMNDQDENKEPRGVPASDPESGA